MIANEERSQSARGKEYQGSTKDGGMQEAKGKGKTANEEGEWRG